MTVPIWSAHGIEAVRSPRSSEEGYTARMCNLYPTGRDGQQIDMQFDSIELAALRGAVAQIHEFLECVHLELRYEQGIEPARWLRQA